MSDWELRLFYLFEWSNEVKDIREQFPLLDLDLAFCIADEMGIEYPKDKNSGVPYVLTTDFMLTVKQGNKFVQIARTIKMSKELEKTKVIEKLYLEKCYWERQNVDWAVVTEQEISKIFADNIKWVHSAYNWELPRENNNENCYYLSNILKDRLTSKKSKISTITTTLDRDMGFESGTSLSLFKHLIARKEIIIDMDKAIISSNSSASIIKEVI